MATLEETRKSFDASTVEAPKPITVTTHKAKGVPFGDWGSVHAVTPDEIDPLGEPHLYVAVSTATLGITEARLNEEIETRRKAGFSREQFEIEDLLIYLATSRFFGGSESGPSTWRLHGLEYTSITREWHLTVRVDGDLAAKGYPTL